MIGNLVRKEFLLARKNLAIIFAVIALALLVMFFVLFSEDTERSHHIGSPALLYIAIFADLAFMQTVAAIEEQNPKAVALLCAAPYPRRSYVIGKYISYLIFCVGCIAPFSFMALILPGVTSIHPADVMIFLFIGMVLYGIYAPVVMKFGVIYARYIYLFSILFLSLAPSFLVRFSGMDMDAIVSRAQELPAQTAPILAAAGVIFLLISMLLSIHIFERKEL